MNGWTYGAEHELADIPRNAPLPAGWGWDVKDNTIVNSNGIANDPRGKLYGFGGEINTPPTDSIAGQAEILNEIVARYPEAKCNYRSNLHFHIRVPGLKDDLPKLKRIAQYNRYWLPTVLVAVNPIPVPVPTLEAWGGAMRRYRRRKRSHHTVLTATRTELMLCAPTVEDFFLAEVPRTAAGGKPMWHAQARAAVNLRQLLDTDTIEFRSAVGTLDPVLFTNAFQFWDNYLCCALSDWRSVDEINPWSMFRGSCAFPAFPPYQHDLEIRYRATCHDGTVSKTQIAENIKQILDGTFHAASWEAKLDW